MSAAAERALAALDAHAAAVSAALVEGAGAGAVTAVFAGGSLGAGRVACFPAATLEIYSDIDLYVVAREDALPAVRAAAQGAAVLAPPADVLLLRPVEIGVYTRADLEAQPARPGTVGVRDHHRVFHGDAGEVEAMLGAIGSDIAPAEGLYLLENRAHELPGAPAAPDSASGRLARYLLGKTVLDAVTALDIAVGPGTGVAGWDAELVAEARRAHTDLEVFLAGAPGTVLEPSRVLQFVLEAWRRGAERVFAGAAPDWGTLILRRCRAGDYKNNLREFLAMSARLGRTRLRMAWTGAGLARYSAVDALRMGAVMDAVLTLGLVDDIGRRSLDGLRAYLDRLTDLFGFGDGALSERVAGMHQIVSGG